MTVAYVDCATLRTTGQRRPRWGTLAVSSPWADFGADAACAQPYAARQAPSPVLGPSGVFCRRVIRTTALR